MNKVVIIYASKHGTTKKVAGQLAEKLENEIALISLKENKNPDISSYDMIILGTSIYAGMPQKVMTKFCEVNKDLLLQKSVGLFICGMQPDQENRKTEMMNAYPEYLYQQAKAKAFLGGEFLFEELNFFEKLIVKKVSKVTDSVQAIDNEAIEKFVKEMLAE